MKKVKTLMVCQVCGWEASWEEDGKFLCDMHKKETEKEKKPYWYSAWLKKKEEGGVGYV